ncbi:uncharacterized protein LMH87_008232 [Akanthomyces muscarius]|uniref:RRM domain-containing protein n=1 Tax=Akanthomyces muscarius TaxID=2231603 RepID=A0A9W8QKQ9_AKAMU|nr:uncharacterized protein LMH87_008232 [Akanthomyces muscarius]KAJ4159327.1 hypothetical protein LMH87_008232 [Akanthomyces muscarius]
MSAEDSKKRLRPEIEEALAAMPDSETVAAPAPKKARTEERRSLFVRSLPPNVTNESLAEFFSEYFPVKHATVVVDQQTKESRGFGFVTLADADDAKQAQTVFDKKHWDGRSIRVEVAEPRQRKEAAEGAEPRQKPGKPEFEPTPKLIVRNLPWTIRNSEQLGHLFRSYGKVKFADLPKNKGKLKGFGFVTLRGKKNAENALEGINGKEIDGRTLAVDWAVDKTTWDQQQADDATSSEGESEAEDDQDDDDEEDDEDKDDQDEDEDEDPAQDQEEGQLNADLENFMKNHMQNIVDEDDEEEDEEETKRKEERNNSSDNSTTIFVRNLPFTTNDEQLKTFFSSFGNVRYARVVMDKATDRPAGTGFVCFFDGEEAKTYTPSTVVFSA